jgi:hypothetical protein
MRKLLLGAAVAGAALVGLGVASKHGRRLCEEHCGESMPNGCQSSC